MPPGKLHVNYQMTWTGKLDLFGAGFHIVKLLEGLGMQHVIVIAIFWTENYRKDQHPLSIL